MAQRLFIDLKWLCCLFVLQAPVRPVDSVTVPTSEPYGIEAQAKFFQDFFSVQLSPYKIEFGHVCEDPHTWEQRYEKKDFKNHRDMGKVRWGDKNGGYGEHYWDLNHAGYTDNHGDDYNGDDGSYHEEPSDVYNSSGDTKSYDSESYSDDIPQYEESGRIKRAHSRATQQDEDGDDYDEQPRRKQKIERYNRKRKERYEEKQEDDDDDESEEIEQTKKSPKIKKERIVEEISTNVPKSKERQVEQSSQRPQQMREKNHYVLVVNKKEKDDDVTNQKQHEPKRFVDYEDGAGVRQPHHPEALAAASVPRLFLETQTGRIVDRMTGQAYVLQPVANTKYNK